MTDEIAGGTYEIRVRGTLDQHSSEWFEGLTLADDGVDTVISGYLGDRAGLHGVLNRIRDLGLFLLSVQYVSSDDRGVVPSVNTGLAELDDH